MCGKFGFSKASAAEKQNLQSGFRPEIRRISGNRSSLVHQKSNDF